MSTATLAAWILTGSFFLLAVVMTLMDRQKPSHQLSGRGVIIVEYVDDMNETAMDGGGAGGSTPNAASPSEPSPPDQTQEPGQDRSTQQR